MSSEAFEVEGSSWVMGAGLRKVSSGAPGMSKDDIIIEDEEEETEER